MTEQVDVAVIGAGPAGLGAALELANFGLSTVLVDSAPQPGGQYYKQTPAAYNTESNLDHVGKLLMYELPKTDITVISDTIVWGIFIEDPGFVLGLYGPEGSPRRIKAKKIILAPGAYDRPVPFPGWTLPGVILAGGAMAMLKSQHILPGKRVLLSGTGPLQLVLASRFIEAGAEVVAVLDANSFPWKGWQYLLRVWGQWERLQEGWNSLRTLRKAGLNITWGDTVVRVEGKDQVTKAIIGPVGSRGEKTLDVDTVCLGYGFVPSIQLSLQAGCDHVYDKDLKCFVPVRDEWLQSSVPGLYIAGDGAGITGKDVALLEGRLAASGVAKQMGCSLKDEWVGFLNRDLARQKHFVDVLNKLFSYPDDVLDLATDDTLICRCEEVTVGQVRRLVAEGAGTLKAIKNITRAGMGRCQGRMCSNSIAYIMSQAMNCSVEEIGHISPNPPVVAIPTEGLLER